MKLAYVFAAACAALAGCNGEVRLVNGVTDSTGMTAQVGADTTEQVPFGSGSTIGTVSEGNTTAQLTSGSSTLSSNSSITINDVPVNKHSLTTLVAFGNFGENTAQGFFAEQSLDKSGGGIDVQPLNAARKATETYPSLTFIIRDVNASGDGTALKTPLGKAPAALHLDARTYQLRIAQDDCGFNGNTCSTSPLLFDSGPNGIALPTGSGSNIFQVVILDAPGQPNNSIVSLLLLDSSGAAIALFNGAH